MVASVDSCLTCHDDTHSLLYENSKHAELFVEEGELPRPSAQSVTCATCHLPRQVHEGATFVNHNNTFTLLPRDRMVGEVCINCHGVENSYNSVFDDELVQANFDQEPSLEMETFELVRALEERRSGGKKQKPKVEQSQQKPQPQPEQLRPLESLTEAELFAVQEALYNAGFDVVVDGLYGPGTAIALEEFQLQNGIDEAGKVGSKTRTALGL
ncbi:MAG: peptidoglycan-binding protein [Microcoleaceae cyanobacterium]